MVPLFSTSPGKWKWSDQKIKEEGHDDDDRWRVKIEEESNTEEEQSAPFINLDLGIGGPTTSYTSSSSDKHHKLKDITFFTDKVEEDDDQMVEKRDKQRSRKLSVFCFTGEQLEEFKAQLMIFKYMVLGLPVPLQLLLPIWRCFSSSSSFSPLYCDLRRRNPIFLGFSSWNSNTQYSMDLEPWRCRRTDGKKWRCHKPTITNEKYCERHMHRGSKRSRKLVESSTQSSHNPGTPGLVNPIPENNPSSDLKIKNFQANLNKEPLLPTPKIPTRVVFKSSFSRSANTDENNELKNVVKDKSIMNNGIAAMRLSSGLDFSPKSVLQDGQKYPQVESPKIDPNAEAERCRRTDGKRWRCRKNVLPNHKYCAHHINRGVKRPSVALSTSGVNFSIPKQSKLNMEPHDGVDFLLAISSGDPKHNSPEDSAVHDGESGSTTETTMTDDSADNSDIIVHSP